MNEIFCRMPCVFSIELYCTCKPFDITPNDRDCPSFLHIDYMSIYRPLENQNNPVITIIDSTPITHYHNVKKLLTSASSFVIVKLQ